MRHLPLYLASLCLTLGTIWTVLCLIWALLLLRSDITSSAFVWDGTALLGILLFAMYPGWPGVVAIIVGLVIRHVYRTTALQRS